MARVGNTSRHSAKKQRQNIEAKTEGCSRFVKILPGFYRIVDSIVKVLLLVLAVRRIKWSLQVCIVLCRLITLNDMPAIQRMRRMPGTKDYRTTKVVTPGNTNGALRCSCNFIARFHCKQFPF